MATCKYCSKSGWFLMLDGVGLCDHCHGVHMPVILQNCRLYDNSVAQAVKSKNPSTILSKLVVAAQCCRALEPYANKGIPTIGPDPKATMEMLDSSFDAAVSESVRSIEDGARLKAASAVGDAGRIGAYAAAVERLMKLSVEFPSVSTFSQKARYLQTEQDALRFDLLLKKSVVAEAKGQKKKALDLTIDALMSLEHDTTPNELQTNLVHVAHERIVALGGIIPNPA